MHAGFESEEQDRPLFVGEQIKSPVDGKDMLYFPESKKKRNTDMAMVELLASLPLISIRAPS